MIAEKLYLSCHFESWSKNSRPYSPVFPTLHPIFQTSTLLQFLEPPLPKLQHNLYSHHRQLQPLFHTRINPLTKIFKIYVKDATHHHYHDNSDNHCVHYSNVSYYTAVNISFVTHKVRSKIYILKRLEFNSYFQFECKLLPLFLSSLENNDLTIVRIEYKDFPSR